MICRISIRRHLTSIVCICFAIFLTIAPVRTINAAAATVISPNGKIKIEFRTDAAGQLTWSVRRQGQTVLAAAPLGLKVDGHSLGQSVTLGTPRNRTINEQYSTWGNHAVAVNLQRSLKESNLLPLDFSLRLIRTLDRIRKKCGIRYQAD